MNSIIITVTKYMIILFMLAYTLECFSAFYVRSEKSRKRIFLRQNIWMFFTQTLVYLALFMEEEDFKLIIFYFMQIIIIGAVLIIYRLFYPSANRLILNNMCMLLAIGFMILTRLSYAKAIRQFSIAAITLAICMFVPFFFKKFKHFDRLAWEFSALGIVLLGIVFLFSRVINGSKLNISVFGISFQPSELIKVTYIFAIAGLLYKAETLKQIIISAAIAGAHVIILVLSKDLGSAVLYFAVYITMLFVATGKFYYYLLGLLAGAAASVAGYYMFSHVRVRVRAFLDPISSIEDAGYQVAQSLFAIGTGGWFGMGVGEGAPNTIPVVTDDFIFSAICEEFGVIFGMCLILICASCLIMFFNIAMRFRDPFYKLLAVGIGTAYGFQVFLTIGGVIKFIPLTGVTLPLVSYGGSSIMVSLVMFSLVEGMYITVKDEHKAAHANNVYVDNHHERSDGYEAY